jgi:hypothetical protein
MRTARSITSGENLTDFFFMAPFSQMMEPPQNPGRFSCVGDLSHLSTQFHICRKDLRLEAAIRREAR